MVSFKLIKHAPGAPGLRLLGLGPGLIPTRGIRKLQKLLNQHAFWAQGRSTSQLRKILASSDVVISLWHGKRLVGFGRATTDGICRAVLWDIVVANDQQGVGLGRQVVEALLEAPAIKEVDRVYLMTTNSVDFYKQLGFQQATQQNLLVQQKIKPGLNA